MSRVSHALNNNSFENFSYLSEIQIPLNLLVFGIEVFMPNWQINFPIIATTIAEVPTMAQAIAEDCESENFAVRIEEFHCWSVVVWFVIGIGTRFILYHHQHHGQVYNINDSS